MPDARSIQGIKITERTSSPQPPESLLSRFRGLRRNPHNGRVMRLLSSRLNSLQIRRHWFSIMAASEISKTDLESFAQHLKDSKNVLALCGAGLSAASGLPTFRGAGGLWRKYDAMSLATPQAFNENPGLVWQFYNYRRHMALQAKPNAGHYALVELAKRKDNFHTLTQNVDGQSSVSASLSRPCSECL